MASKPSQPTPAEIFLVQALEQLDELYTAVGTVVPAGADSVVRCSVVCVHGMPRLLLRSSFPNACG
jgi:hypothetical protein